MSSADSFSRRLAGADELMWRIEVDPVLRSPILVVGVLDRAPTESRVRRTLASWQAAFPRLGQRLVPAPRVLGGARWVDCGASLDYHVRRVGVPEPADLRAVLDLVEPMAVEPFDEARPPWELTIVEGLTGGRAALVLRFHHSMTDGVGGVQLAGQLFDRTRRAAPRPAPAPATGDRERNPVAAAGRFAVAAAARGLAAARHPLATGEGVVRLARSLARGLAPAPPGSPAFPERGLDRFLDVTEIPLADLQRAAEQIGCTLNDVFLAAIGGALHAYHERIGQPVAVIQCTMPISLRAEGDASGGNRFAPARFALPVDDPDPAVRARIAGTITRRWRAEPALGWTGAISTALDLLPREAASRVLGSMLKRVDVDAVNVPGLRRAAYFAGSRVERLWAFAPPTGAAMSVTLLSHVDTCCIGLMCDRQAVGEPELVHSCLVEALAEVAGLGAADHATRKVPA